LKYTRGLLPATKKTENHETLHVGSIAATSLITTGAA